MGTGHDVGVLALLIPIGMVVMWAVIYFGLRAVGKDLVEADRSARTAVGWTMGGLSAALGVAVVLAIIVGLILLAFGAS